MRGIPRLVYSNYTLMRSTPMLADILAIVRKVKLCVPHVEEGIEKVIKQCLDIKKNVFSQPIKKREL